MKRLRTFIRMLWLKITDYATKLRGIIDAVYRNSKDDGIIVIDWKTGLYRPWKIDDYRFELAIYKKLYEGIYKEEVKYWGIFFTDPGKLFFEEASATVMSNAMNIVEQVRAEMEAGNYKCKCGKCEKW